MAAVAPIAAVGGLLLQGGATIAGGIARARGAALQSSYAGAQADELLQREAINEDIIRRQGQDAELHFGAAQGGTGFGGGVGGFMTIRKNTEELLAHSARDAQFKAQMIRSGAEIDSNLASDAATAGLVSGAGTLLTGGANIYYSNYYKPNNTPPSLPNVDGAGPVKSTYLGTYAGG